MNETTDEMLDTEDDEAMRAFLRGEGLMDEDVESIIAAGAEMREALSLPRYMTVAEGRLATNLFKRDLPEIYPRRWCEVPTCERTPATRFVINITTAKAEAPPSTKYACRKHTDGVRAAISEATVVTPQLIAQLFGWKDIRWTWSEEAVS